MRFEVFISMKHWVVVFGIMSPFSLVDGLRCFWATCFLHFQGMSEFEFEFYFTFSKSKRVTKLLYIEHVKSEYYCKI
jgi:hypothetical protein